MAGSQLLDVSDAGRLAATTNQPAATRVFVVAAMGSFLNLATLIVYPFGVFAIAIAKSNGWSSQTVVAMIGPALLMNFWTAPAVGWAVDHFHKPRVAVLALMGLGAGVGLLAIAPQSERLLGITVAVSVLLASAATGTIYSALVSQAFERRRGLALGSMMAFGGLGVGTIPVVSVRLIEAWGWRAAYGILGAFTIAVALVSSLILRAPSSALSRRPRMLATEKALSRAIRQPTFWIIAALVFLWAATANSIALHLPLILEQRGSSAAIGAFSVSVVGLTTVASRPAIGYLIDRLPIRVVLTVMLAGPVVGCASLMLTSGGIPALISAFGFGLAIGGEFVCLGYMVSRAFPLEHFGIVYGWLGLGLVLGQGIGPTAISMAVRLGGGYGPSLAMSMGGCLLALVLSWSLEEPRFRRQPRSSCPGPAA